MLSPVQTIYHVITLYARKALLFYNIILVIQMFHDKACSAVILADETASVTPFQGSGSISVTLVDISVSGVKFISANELESVITDQLSLRFTLPGSSRLHFALIMLQSIIATDGTGFRYEAKFIKADPETIDHILHHFIVPHSKIVSERGTLDLY